MSLGLYLRDFRDFITGGSGKPWLQEAENKKRKMQAGLSKENFPAINEDTFRGLLVSLDSLPKQRAAQTADELIAKYGLETVKGELYHFLYGERPIEERFDQVREAVPRLPPVALLELATFAVPRDFCLWDETAREMIRFVGQSRMHGLSENAFTEGFSGWDYVASKTALNHIRELLRSYLQRRADFVDVHLFSRYIYETEIKKLMKAQGRDME